MREDPGSFSRGMTQAGPCAGVNHAKSPRLFCFRDRELTVIIEMSKSVRVGLLASHVLLWKWHELTGLGSIRT